MQASQTPTLVPLAFAANGTKNAIPESSQIGITPGAASLNDGFPPLTFTPIAAGGVPPAGADFNGVLNLVTQTIRWKHAGGQFGYNSAFATDANVGGYPKGALLLRADQAGFWLNQTDNNTTNPDSGGAGWVAAFPLHGQCRLSVASTTSLLLSPYNGNSVVVNGIPLQIPGAGISVSNSGLAANTVYFVYLGGTTASPTLTLSTTGHTTQSNGITTMTGNSALTLVGMIATNSSSQFVDSVTQRFCLNWFNRRNLQGNAQGLGLTTTSTSAVEISTTLRVSFLNWTDEQIYSSAAGSMANNTVNDGSSIQLNMDGINGIGPAQTTTSFTANQAYPYNSATSNARPSEGAIHYTTLFGQVTVGGTMTITCNNSVLLRG